METSSIWLTPVGQRAPVDQPKLYGSTVAIKNSWKAGLLYIVTPPSTKIKCRGPTWTTSGGKYVGAAVLARTSCHSGSWRLQSSKVVALNFAPGLFERGQGESVVALRRISSSRVCNLSLPRV